MKKLPKTIYVTLENEGDGPFLLAGRSIDDINPDKLTGIYELKKTGTIVNKSEFVQK